MMLYVYQQIYKRKKEVSKMSGDMFFKLIEIETNYEYYSIATNNTQQWKNSYYFINFNQSKIV